MKPTVLVVVGNYLPGHKAGGTVRTVVNTVDHLCGEYEFRVVTRDRDLGDTAPFPGVPLRTWHPVGNAQVYYLPPEFCTVAGVREAIKSVPHDVLYVNSLFDPLSVKTIWNVRTGAVTSRRYLLAPRGEFAWASLGQKYPKKLLFMWVARAIGLCRDFIWHASSTFEADDIANVMKVDRARIHVAFDFAVKESSGDQPAPDVRPLPPGDGRLRIVFLSRIAREKNLDYALTLLRKVKAPVVFDIWGPAENAQYWAECQVLMAQLPPNVQAEYHGPAGVGQVMNTFSRYDLFLFPSGGEAYGHVIAECLMAGTPVLTSTETAWRNLDRDGLGWDLDLKNQDAFIETIERYAALAPAERMARREAVKAGVRARLADPSIANANRELFGSHAR